MPNILIIAQAPDFSLIPGNITVSGQAIAEGAPIIGFTVQIGLNDNPAQINTKIINEAVAEFARINPPVIVGGGDRKNLLAGAI